MDRRRFIGVTLTGTLAATGLSGCALFAPRETRQQGDGFIVRPKPRLQDNATEILATDDTMFISGSINDDSATAFAAVREANPGIQRVVFLNAGGAQGSAAGIALGRAVRTAGLQTYLQNDSRISGAAVDAFLGGTARTAEDGAVVGALTGASDLDAHVAYVTEMTGGDGFARFANEFGGTDQPRVMTIAEIGAMGVISGSDRRVLAAG